MYNKASIFLAMAIVTFSIVFGGCKHPTNTKLIQIINNVPGDPITIPDTTTITVINLSKSLILWAGLGTSPSWEWMAETPFGINIYPDQSYSFDLPGEGYYHVAVETEQDERYDLRFVFVSENLNRNVLYKGGVLE